MVTEIEGVREPRSMVWGFPLRLKGMKPEAKLKPVNNIAHLSKGMSISSTRKPRPKLYRIQIPENWKGPPVLQVVVDLY